MSNRRLYADNAKTTLASSVFPADTTITVTDGSLFPNPVDGDFFAVTIDAGTSAREIIHVYARSMNTFTSCVRGQEGTVAGGFGAGTRIENRATAQTYRDMARKVDRLGDIDSVDSLPAPIDTDANSYLTQSLDDTSSPIIAVKNNTKWSFTTHPFLVTASSVTSDSGSNALTSLGIGAKLPDFQSGKYILTFTSGPNQGLARLLTSASDDEVTWAGNALPNLYGVEFEVYQSSVSAIIDAASQGGTGALDEVQKPVNLLPEAGAASTGITPTLVGSTFRSLYGYPHQSSQFQIALNPTFTQIAADTGTIAAATSWTPATPLDQNNAYFWRVRYRDSAGFWSQFSDATSFSTGNVVVAVPSIIAPTAGAVGVPVNPQVRGSNFSVVGGSDTHESSDWEIWTGPNGTGTRVFHSENNTTDKTVIQVTGLNSLTSYYVRVRYKGATYGLSSWSGSVQFSTSGFIATPSITSPANEEEDLPETFQMTSSAFSVNGSTDTHASTDWQIWTGANGTGTKVWEAMGVTGAQRTVVTVPKGTVEEDSTYYARARYRGQTLPVSSWSVSVKFSTEELFFTGVIGEEYEGGYYSGAYQDGATWKAVIVSGPGGDMETTGSTAENKCTSLVLNGYSDWIQPNMIQAIGAYSVFKPVTTSNMHVDSVYTSSTVPTSTTVEPFMPIGSAAFRHDAWAMPGGGYFFKESGYPTGNGLLSFRDGRYEAAVLSSTKRVRAIRLIDHPPGVFQPRITNFFTNVKGGGISSTITSSPFQGVAPGLGGHVRSDWQIWSGPNGTGALIYQEMGSTSKLIRNDFNGVVTSGTFYYPRVRYHAGNGMVSPWSLDSCLMAAPFGSDGTLSSFGGGFYVSRYVSNGITYALIASPKSGGWMTGYGHQTTPNNFDPGLLPTQIDGMVTTNILAAQGIPQAVWAKNLNIGGQNDWYIPTWKEAILMYWHGKPTTASNFISFRYDRTILESEFPTVIEGNFTHSVPGQTAEFSFREGGAQSFYSVSGRRMYTSTWANNQDNPTLASNRNMYFIDGSGGTSSPLITYDIRAVRKVRINQ